MTGSRKLRSSDAAGARRGHRVTMRTYFSSHLLWSAKHAAALAAQEEAGGDRQFDKRHRGYVLASLVAASNFLEAAANELFQDAADSYGISHRGYLATVNAEAIRTMGQFWESSNGGRGIRTLEKFQLMLVFSGAEILGRGQQPYQDAALVVALRNEIVHYIPESLAFDVPHRLRQKLEGKFEPNALMAGIGNPWWPDHCLGAGCAFWAVESAEAFADRALERIGIRANFARLRDEGWFADASKGTLG